MKTCEMITHVIEKGDTLYRLAQKYKTTVPLILLQNPGINPYNLEVGSKIKVCKGNPPVEKPSMDEIQMTEDLEGALYRFAGRLFLFLQALYQTPERRRETGNELERATGETVDVLEVFFPTEASERIRQQFVQGYVRSLMNYGSAVKERNEREEERLEGEISKQAEMLATTLDRYVRRYDKAWLEDILEELPELVEEIVEAEEKDSPLQELAGFRKLERWAARLASYLATGIRQEYYREG